MEKSRAGIHGSPVPKRFSLFLHFRHELLHDLYRLSCEYAERSIVGGRETANNNVDIAQQWNDLRPGQLSQTSSKAVSLDDRVTVLGNDHGHPCM